MENDLNSVQVLLDALQQAQFCLYATAQVLNKTADEITEAVENAGIKIVNHSQNVR